MFPLTVLDSRWRKRVAGLVAVLLLAVPGRAAGALPPPTAAGLKLPENPGSFGYRFIDAFPGLAVTNPVVITAPRGETNRLFIVEQAGRIVVITNLAQPTRTVFLDLTRRTLSGGEQGLLGLAFHPDYARNGQFFVFRTLNWTPPDAGMAYRMDRLSRFQVHPDRPQAADPNSEVMLFQEFDEASNHNGGDLHFGLDGYLYVALGDEGGANDQFNNGQRIDRDFFAGLLRLDVDKRPGSLPPNPHEPLALSSHYVTDNYAIPPDNPYVGATTFNGRTVNTNRLRTEFWAVGLRNPWRFSFDAAGGELWVADVGQDRWESIFVSRAGANHGWAFREGNAAGARSSATPAGFLTNPAFNHVPPVHVYGHGGGPTQGNSVTGGLVYRGRRLAPLHGAYVFADYVSGNVWALWRQTGAAPRVQRLTGQGGISAFGTDPRNGDLLAAAHSGNRLLRLTYSTTFTGEPLPPTLADTGAFSDLATLAPAPGVVPYEINHPFWSDGAAKRRWFALGSTNRLLGFREHGAWEAPPGTVWVKHFDLELTNGVPASARRLETRFLVRNANGVHGLTYRWDSPTNATLVPEDGAVEAITRYTAEDSPTHRSGSIRRAPSAWRATRPPPVSRSASTRPNGTGSSPGANPKSRRSRPPAISPMPRRNGTGGGGSPRWRMSLPAWRGAPGPISTSTAPPAIGPAEAAADSSTPGGKLRWRSASSSGDRSTTTAAIRPTVCLCPAMPLTRSRCNGSRCAVPARCRRSPPTSPTRPRPNSCRAG